MENGWMMEANKGEKEQYKRGRMEKGEMEEANKGKEGEVCKRRH